MDTREDATMISNRVHLRSAIERIHTLTEFVRDISKAHIMNSLDTGNVIDYRYKLDALELVCSAENCDNAPGAWEDDKGYCRDHAPEP